MKTFTDCMTDDRLIAILRGIPSETLIEVLDALYAGGVHAAEITYDFSGTVPARQTAADIERAVVHTAGRMHIGAGTVTRPEQLERTKASGGEFIISPNTDETIIAQTKKLGMFSIPGAMTVSEICRAVASGADYVKLFPVSVLGADFVKSVLAPLSGVKLLAVSGVGLDDIPAYRAAGCVGFGIGGGIANRALCEARRFDRIRDNARAYAEAVVKS